MLLKEINIIFLLNIGFKLDCLEVLIDLSVCVIIFRKDDGKMMMILDKV